MQTQPSIVLVGDLQRSTDPPRRQPRWTSWTRGQLFVRCTVAGVLAGAVEVMLFIGIDGDLSTEVALTHVGWLAAVGALSGALALLRRSEPLAARLWLTIPSLMAIQPVLDRAGGGGLAWLAVGLVALVAAWPGRNAPPRADSVIVGAITGVALARQVALFAGRHVGGLPADPTQTATLALTTLVAVAVYVAVPRIVTTPVLSTLTRTLPVAALVLAGLHVASGASIQTPSAPPSARPEPPRPVVVIVLDTVRADRLELYGYHHDTMPGLTSFARSEAVVVERAITNAPDSLSAHASLFTGRFPSRHGAHRPVLADPHPPRFGYPLRSDLPTLAERLREHGYTTVTISGGAGPISAEAGLGLDRGFDIYHARPSGDCRFARQSPWARPIQALAGTPLPAWLPVCTSTHRTANEITREAIAMVDALPTSRFFLFVNYIDARFPYDPPPPFRPPVAAVGRQIGDPRTSATARARAGALYDAELRYVDDQLTRLLDRLRRHPAWHDLLLVITSDHGDAIGEHGLVGHASSLYDVMIRVPLVLKLPGHLAGTGFPSAGRRWNRPMQLVDVMPLVLRHAGLPAIPTDGTLPPDPPAPLRAWSFPSRALMRADARFTRELRSIEIDGWKLIEDDAGQVELYDIRNDPGEEHDRADAEPERVLRMRMFMGHQSVYRIDAVADGPAPAEEALDRLPSPGLLAEPDS